MHNIPTGTVTFLFTDIEGSTKRWEQYPQQMRSAVQRHDQLLRQAIEANGGYVFKTVGDAFCATFSTAIQALNATLAAQQALYSEDWGKAGDIGAVKARMALHTGTAEERDGDYFGQAVNRVARLLSAGHGGQSLLSLATQQLVCNNLPQGVELLDMGECRLKDLIRPERVFQVVTQDLPPKFPPLKTLDNRPNNLPVQFTLLIGREKEVVAACTLLQRPEVRLVSFTGPSGTGKTRLSLQVAADLLEDFHDGVWFIELAPLTEYSMVASAIAQTLGVKEVAGQPLLSTLQDHMRDKQMLLVLDNSEQVEEAAPLVDSLLKAAPHCKVLVTSRVRLRLYGEKEFVVPPLNLPDLDHLPSIERVMGYDAVRLFVERAQDVKSDFQLNDENARVVAEICTRLDGLPLAIELAAARVRLFSPRALLARLDHRLKLLTGGARNLPVRQQTLRGAIEWSYDLLNEGEKHLFSRMAVFQGGGPLEALEAVCAADGDLQVEVLDGVESLISKSMVQQREGIGGEPRFRMLETIHEYAWEKLEESGETEQLRNRHLDYFLIMAEEVAPQLQGTKHATQLARLDFELGNLRVAIQWALEQGDTEKVARMGGALWAFMWTRGYLSEGRRWLDAALKSPLLSKEVRAGALGAAGILAHDQGDYARAEACFEEALELRRELGDKRGIALALNRLGVLLHHRGEYDRARPIYEESLAFFHELKDQHRTAVALNNLGVVAERQDNYEQARDYYNQSLELARKLQDKEGIAVALDNLGNIACLQSNYDEAWKLHRESLILFQELGDKQGIAVCLEHMASVAGAFRQPEEAERAARLFGAAEALRETSESVIHPSKRKSYEQSVAVIRAQLDDNVWQAAWAMGRTMPLEQILAFSDESHKALNAGA